MGRWTAAVAALLLAACSSKDVPRHLVESPAGSGNWVEVAAEPAWVAAPPAVEGTLRFVATARSNLHSIVFRAGWPSAEGEAVAAVRARLAPLGEEAAAAGAAAVPGALRLAARACREEILTRDPVPGNTLCTGWALWEVPVERVVEALPEGVRGAAREALLR